MDIILRSSCPFFLSEAAAIIFSEAAARSVKNIEMFLEAATHKKLHISFQKQSFTDIFQKPFLKKHWNTPRSSHTFAEKEKIYSEAAAYVLSQFLHKVYTLCFYNL